MKRFLRILVLSVLMVWGGQSVAQTHGYVFLGASFPMGDFAKMTDFNLYALRSNASELSNQGGAGIGFNAGFKWNFNVGVRGLNVMISADGFFNGSNEQMKAEFINFENRLKIEEFTNGLTMTKPKYINVPLMLGLNYIFYFNPSFGIFAEAGAGCNFRWVTDWEYNGKYSTLLGVNISKVVTDHYSMAFGFAYQAGLGFEIAKNLVLGCSYYNLGQAKVKGEKNTKTVIGSNVNMNTDHFDEGVLRTSMIVARVGFRF